MIIFLHMIEETLMLNNGRAIPRVGLGTSQMQGVASVVENALSLGYRHIDTAKMYGNETEVGEGIHASSVEREEIFVTTKLWRDDLGYDSAHQHIDASLGRLKLEYVDLYLIHWPGPITWTDLRKETWKAMEEILEQGKAKSVGVSNYTIANLEEMEAYQNVIPAVNQIEFHPWLYSDQKKVHDYCRQKGIVITSYSPLTRASELNDVLVREIAEKHVVSSSQILLRWNIQHGNVVIPKASSTEYLEENLDIFSFELDTDDMEKLNQIGSSRSFL